MFLVVEIEYPDGQQQESQYTMEELLRPNGSEPFIAWFLRELDKQGVKKIRIESAIHPDGYPDTYYAKTGP